MSNYTARVPADQQYHLIMECRSSGLSDYQWCKENNIQPGTFYNWVSRLRKKACCEIPGPASKSILAPASPQEIVKLDLLPQKDVPCQPLAAPYTTEKFDDLAALATIIEISLGNATIRISNGIELALLDQILSLVRGAVC